MDNFKFDAASAEKLRSAFMLMAHAASDVAISMESPYLAIDDRHGQHTKSAAAEAIKLAKIGT